MLSFYNKVDFSSDVKSFVIVHKNCYGFLLHSKHVLIVDFFLGMSVRYCNVKIMVYNQI
jgi:hypothetical protein